MDKAPDGAQANTKLIYRDESYKIMGACFEVYKQMGCGFLEAVYHECLELEFTARRIPYVARMPLTLHYAGVKLNQGYALDFLLYDKIVLEVKALATLAPEHRAQTLNYLCATGLQLGLLVNFGTHPKLQYDRLVRLDDLKD